jgi:hypothetical protein
VLSLLVPVVLLDPEPTCPSKGPTLLKVVNFYIAAYRPHRKQEHELSTMKTMGRNKKNSVEIVRNVTSRAK